MIRNGVARWWHGTGLRVIEGDHCKEPAFIGMARRDPVPGVHQAGELLSVTKGWHVCEMVLAVAVDAVGFQDRDDAGKGTWLGIVVGRRQRGATREKARQNHRRGGKGAEWSRGHERKVTSFHRFVNAILW